MSTAWQKARGCPVGLHEAIHLLALFFLYGKEDNPMVMTLFPCRAVMNFTFNLVLL